MKDLITALQILVKYVDGKNEACPTFCSHDQLTVCVDPAKVSAEDIAMLETLGFIAEERDECFISFRLGNC